MFLVDGNELICNNYKQNKMAYFDFLVALVIIPKSRFYACSNGGGSNLSIS